MEDLNNKNMIKNKETIYKGILGKLDEIWQKVKVMGADELSIKLVGLSALLANISEEMIEAEQVFVNEQLRIWQVNEKISAKEMEVRAKASVEYKEYRQWQSLEKATVETIRSIKKRLMVLQNEREVSTNL